MHDLRRLTRHGRILIVASLAAWLPSAGRASGFYLQEQSARGTGRAYSGEAADQGPASLWWNPASIAGLEHSELDSSLTGVQLWSKSRNQGSTIQRAGRIGAEGSDDIESNVISNGIVPAAAGALRLSDQWALGLSVTAPFDFATQYGSASWTRYAALTSRVQTIDIQPSLAWRPTSWLGLGGGPNIEHVLAALSTALPNLTASQPDGITTLHGTGWNAGYNLGLQLHVLDDRLTFGAAYRSRIVHDVDGTFDVAGLQGYLAGENGHGHAQAGFTTPWAATFGIRYRATKNLTLDAQLVRTGWSEFDAVRITQPVGSISPQNYHDVSSYAVGLDYILTPAWKLRTGVQFDPTPSPDTSRNPDIPDGDRWMFGFGTSVMVTRQITIDASALYLDIAPSRINRDASAYGGTPFSTPVRLHGTIGSNSLILALATRVVF